MQAPRSRPTKKAGVTLEGSVPSLSYGVDTQQVGCYHVSYQPRPDSAGQIGVGVSIRWWRYIPEVLASRHGRHWAVHKWDSIAGVLGNSSPETGHQSGISVPGGEMSDGLSFFGLGCYGFSRWSSLKRSQLGQSTSIVGSVTVLPGIIRGCRKWLQIRGASGRSGPEAPLICS